MRVATRTKGCGVLARKSFATPLGGVPTDLEVTERLLAAYEGPDDLLAGEFHHRAEHSIEFQTVYLRALLGETRGPRTDNTGCE